MTELSFAAGSALRGFDVLVLPVEDHIDSGVLRTIIELNPAEHVLRPMREVMLSGYDWGDIGVGFGAIAALGLVALPLTARNYRSVYG